MTHTVGELSADIIKLRREWLELGRDKPFTNANITNTVNWFTDKYNIPQVESCCIARGELTLVEVRDLLGVWT